MKLRQRGFTNIATANSGEEALLMIAALEHESHTRYDAIFMDVMMPQVKREIKKKLHMIAIFKISQGRKPRRHRASPK